MFFHTTDILHYTNENLEGKMCLIIRKIVTMQKCILFTILLLLFK